MQKTYKKKFVPKHIRFSNINTDSPLWLATEYCNMFSASNGASHQRKWGSQNILSFFYFLQLHLSRWSQPRGSFTVLGPEQCRDVNPCTLANMQHPVAILPEGQIWSDTQQIFYQRQNSNLLTRNSADGAQQEAGDICTFLRDFTTIWKCWLLITLSISCGKRICYVWNNSTVKVKVSA